MSRSSIPATAKARKQTKLPRESAGRRRGLRKLLERLFQRGVNGVVFIKGVAKATVLWGQFEARGLGS